MVIGGYTKNDDTCKLFSALLVGVYDKGKLRYSCVTRSKNIISYKLRYCSAPKSVISY
jgi:hypothetical protein